jgi:hypothetical protein
MGRCLSTSLFKWGFVNSPLGEGGIEARAKHLGERGGGGMFVYHFVQKYICKKFLPRGIELMTFMTVASLLANCASCGWKKMPPSGSFIKKNRGFYSFFGANTDFRGFYAFFGARPDFRGFYSFWDKNTDFRGFYALKMATPISGVFILLPVYYPEIRCLYPTS